MKSNAKTVIDKRLVRAIKQTLKDAPKELGNEGEKSIKENFATQSYEGKKWQAVKSKKKRGPILVGKTRKLIGAARSAYKGTYQTWLFKNIKLKWSIDGVAYAKIHNEGGTIKKKSRTATQNFKVKGDGSYRYAKLHKANFQMDVKIGKHKIKMPKRQFIGKSPKFIKRLSDRLLLMFNKNLK